MKEVRHKVEDRVYWPTGALVRNQVSDQVWLQVGDQIRWQVRWEVWWEVGYLVIDKVEEDLT